jgi:hypothetical protein
MTTNGHPTSKDHDGNGRFKPGNKAARKKKKPNQSLVSYLKQNTNDGQLLFDKLLEIIRNKKSKPKDVLDATKLLLDRGWGKVPISTDSKVDANVTFRWEGEDDTDSNNSVPATPIPDGDTPKPEEV